MGRGPTGSAIRRTSPDARSTRTARASSRPSGSPRSGRPRRPVAIARTSWLHGPPGNDFPAQDRRRGAPGEGRGPATQGRQRRDRDADLHPRRRRRDRRADLGGRAVRRRPAWRGSTTSSTAAAPPGRTGRARSCGRPGIDVEIEEVPGVHVAARQLAAPVGRPRAHAAARRASRCATGGSRSPTPCRPSGGPSRPRADRATDEARPPACRPAPRDRLAVRPRTKAYSTGLHRTRQRQPERASRGLTIPRLAPPSPAARLGRH